MSSISPKPLAPFPNQGMLHLMNAAAFAKIDLLQADLSYLVQQANSVANIGRLTPTTQIALWSSRLSTYYGEQALNKQQQIYNLSAQVLQRSKLLKEIDSLAATTSPVETTVTTPEIPSPLQLPAPAFSLLRKKRERESHGPILQESPSRTEALRGSCKKVRFLFSEEKEEHLLKEVQLKSSKPCAREPSPPLNAPQISSAPKTASSSQMSDDVPSPPSLLEEAPSNLKIAQAESNTSSSSFSKASC